MKGPDIGDVWVVDLNDSRDHEQSGTRPAVIMAVSYGMRIAVPFTTSDRASSFPHTHFILPDENNGLSKESYALIFQLVSLDENRFTDKWGSLSEDDLLSIKVLLQDMLQL